MPTMHSLNFHESLIENYQISFNFSHCDIFEIYFSRRMEIRSIDDVVTALLKSDFFFFVFTSYKTVLFRITESGKDRVKRKREHQKENGDQREDITITLKLETEALERAKHPYRRSHSEGRRER